MGKMALAMAMANVRGNKSAPKKKKYASPFANKPLQRCSTTAAIFGL